MEESAKRKVLGLLGFGARARTVVIGVAQVRAAAERGKLALVVVAPDASRHSRAKVLPLVEALRIDVIEGPTAAELGAVVGKEGTAAIGVLNAAASAADAPTGMSHRTCAVLRPRRRAMTEEIPAPM